MERGVVETADVELVAGTLGEFHITIDSRVAFDKADTHRFPTDEDIDGLV